MLISRWRGLMRISNRILVMYYSLVRWWVNSVVFSQTVYKYLHVILYHSTIALRANYYKLNGLQQSKFILEFRRSKSQNPYYWAKKKKIQVSAVLLSFLEALGRIHFLDFFIFKWPIFLDLYTLQLQSQHWSIFSDLYFYL